MYALRTVGLAKWSSYLPPEASRAHRGASYRKSEQSDTCQSRNRFYNPACTHCEPWVWRSGGDICRLRRPVHIGVQVIEKVSNRIHASPATGFIILHVRTANRGFCEVESVRAEVWARKQPLPFVHSRSEEHT